MLQLCDKGAILFADRYLPSHLMSEEDETSPDGSSSRKDVLGPLIKAIILDNVADLNPAMARRALLLIKYVRHKLLIFCILFLFFLVYLYCAYVSNYLSFSFRFSSFK